MAFNLLHFQFARGVDFAYTQGSGVTTVMHSYKSSVDTVSTITTPGYFPNNIDGSNPNDKVFVNDQIMIIGTDSTALVNILSLAPVTLSANLFESVPPLVVGAPFNATDAFGLRISGNTLSLEFANGSFPGIVSIADQIFSGNKVFVDPVVIGTGYIAAAGGPNDLQILTTAPLAGVNVQTNGSGVIQYSFGSPTIPTSSYAGIEWALDGFGASPPSPELALYNASAPGLIMMVGQICFFPTGIRLGARTNIPITTYNEGTFSSTFTDGVTTTPSFAFTWRTLNNVVNISLNAPVLWSSGGAPGLFVTSNTFLPVNLRPAQNVYGSFFFNQTSGVGKAGLFEINSSGAIIIYWDPNRNTNFAPGTIITFECTDFPYSLV